MQIQVEYDVDAKALTITTGAATVVLGVSDGLSFMGPVIRAGAFVGSSAASGDSMDLKELVLGQ